jgi:ubiquinone/menaquinone biosynthesis C-methylase UbiE
MADAESLSPADWQQIDAADAGAAAADYLDAAAAAIEVPRRRAHELLGIGPGGAVLDAGCGTGIALREIADLVGPAGTVVGLDPSRAMLDQTAARLDGVAATVELVERGVTDTGLASDRFDAVRTERVLMHVAAQRDAMAELARVTRPGGRIVLVEPDHRRLALDTDTPDVWVQFMTGFSRMLPNLSAGLRAPAEATALGLPVLAIEPITYQFRTWTGFSEVFDVELGRQACYDLGVTEAEFDGLIAEMVRRDADRRFLAVGTMYVVAIEKPVRP